jgi:hypothetical protein
MAVKPPRVASAEEFWTAPPPTRSPRCAWWLAQLDAGWSPNRRVRAMGYSEAARFFGVYLWEYLNVLAPRLKAERSAA